MVVTGNLTVQLWAELHHRFGLELDIVTRLDLESCDTINILERKPLPIARADHLARRQEQQRPSLARHRAGMRSNTPGRRP